MSTTDGVEMSDTLVAGPELDARIAAEVMGLHVVGEVPIHYDPEYVEPGPLPFVDSHAKGRAYAYVPEGGCFCFEPDLNLDNPLRYYGHLWTCLEIVPPYSTLIRYAWEVWKKWESEGFEPSIYKRGNIYRAHRQVAGNIWADADTPELAICSAALFANEVEK